MISRYTRAASSLTLVCASLVSSAGELTSAATFRFGSAVDDAGNVQTAEASLLFDVDVTFNEAWTASGSMRVRADSKDLLEPGRPLQDERSRFNRRWLLGDTADAELRELYVDGEIGSVFVRLGKQQIVWGQADGVRVLDVVNPFSFREFIWPDPQDRRIALWSAKLEMPIGPAVLQLIWLPDQTYDEIPVGEAAFAITSPLLIPQATGPTRLLATERPEGGLDSSDVGARLSAFAAGWDLTLNYLSHYYDDPVPFVTTTSEGPAVAPRYERTHLAGISFSNAFGSTTVRGEMAYSTDRWFITAAPLDHDRVFASDEAALVVGLDNTAMHDTLISAQFYVSYLVDPAAGMTRERAERQLTVLLQKSVFNESLKVRALALRSLNRDDGAIQTKISWQLSEGWQLALSAERFYGNRHGLFGQFRDASRAGLELVWNWQRMPK